MGVPRGSYVIKNGLTKSVYNLNTCQTRVKLLGLFRMSYCFP